MSIVRTSGSGLLDRNESDNGSFPFATSEWTAPSGWTEFGIVAGKMVIESTGNHAPGWITRDISNAGEMMVYVRNDHNNALQMGLGVLVSNIAAGSQDGIEGACACSFSGGRFLTYWTTGSVTVIDSTGSGINLSSPHQLSLWANATDAALRDHANAVTESGTYPSAKTGKPGIFCDFGSTGQQFNVEKFFVFNGRYVTVSGLSSGSGQKAKIRKSDGTVLATATESGGTAVIDCLTITEYWTIHNIAVFTSADALIESNTGDVWPGEAWLFSAPAITTDDIASTAVLYAPTITVGDVEVTGGTITGTVLYPPMVTSGPDEPTIFEEETGARYVVVRSSDYSSPDPIGAVRWERADDSGFSVNLETVLIEYDNPEDAPDPLTYSWPDLEPSTTYWFRVQHVDEDGDISGFSEGISVTTDAEVLPATPSIVLATPGSVSVALYGSTYSDPGSRAHVSSDWQVATAAGSYASPVNESLGDVSGLTSEDIGGLTAGTAYKARLRYRADDGSYSAWSADKLFTTLTVPANRPAQPTLVVSAIEQTTAILTGSAYSDPGPSPHYRTQWYVTNWPGGGTFGIAYRVLDFTTPTFLLSIGLDDLLEPDVLYNAAVRYQAQDGDWSDWSAWVPFTTDADTLGGELLQIQQPRGGEPIRGAAVNVAWTPEDAGDSTFELEYSGDLGITWLPLDEVDTSPYAWDVTGLTDGVYLLRIRGVSYEEDVTDWQYRIVYVDNANEQAAGVYLFNYNADTVGGDGSVIGDWDAAWNEADIGWAVDGNRVVRYTVTPPASVTKGNIDSALRFLPAFEPRSADIIGEVLIGSQGGAFPWNWFPEQAAAGVGMFSVGGVIGLNPSDGIAATIHALPITAYGDCEVRGSGDGFLTISAYEGGTRILSTAVSIGRVHVVNQFAGCTKVPRYGVRLRLTTIADLPGSRRRLRVQVSVTGRGIEPTETGWQYEGTVETGLDCGCAAFVASNINTTTGSYRSFTNLTVIPYEYGTCDAPVGFSEPEDVELCPTPFFDLTIFDDDDVTPLFGSVDEYGEIVEACFSTDPAHPRPWLIAWKAGAQHEVDPITAESNIGTLVAEVIDKRVDPCDQSTGYLTSFGADAESFSNYIGRRALARERLSDGSIHIVQNGPIPQVTLLDTLVTYRLDVASMREREREVALFDTQYETLSAYPYGPVNGYGLVNDDVYLIPPAPVADGVYQFDITTAGVAYGRIQNEDATWFLVRKGLDLLGQPQQLFPDVFISGFYHPLFVLRWRYPGDGDDDWRYIRNMPGTASPAFNFVTLANPQEVGDEWAADKILVEIRLNVNTPEDDTLKPPNGAAIEFQILANSQPSEEFPFMYEGPFGSLLRSIYDGEFSPDDPAIRYDEACMAEFESTGPWARLIREEPEDDMREWVQNNIYQASGWLPSLNEDGLICPINGAVPDGDESLVTLDNAVVINANWGQDGSRATPIVDYRFTRELIAKIRRDDEFSIISQPVTIEKVASARAGVLLKSKVLVIEPETVRSVAGYSIYFGPPTFDPSNDDAARLAFDRASILSSLFAFGPQIVTCRVRDTAVTRQIVVGDWVILDVAWIPNLSTLLRGGPQLALVTSRQKDPGLAWDLTLILGGPGEAGLQAIELDTPTVGDSNEVCVEITADMFSDYNQVIRVQYGIGTTEPTSWYLAGTVSSDDDLPVSVCTPVQLDGTKVWMRARLEQFGFRPAPWSDPVFVTVGAATPALFSLAVNIALDGTPTVFWTRNANTLGVLVEFGIAGSAISPTYPDSVEVDATLLQVELTGETVNDGQRISVKATPYTGYGGGMVSGTPGNALYTFADMTEVPIPEQDVDLPVIAATTTLYAPTVTPP